MQDWCHGWHIGIIEYNMSDRDRMAEAFQAHAKQLHCQAALKLLKQERCFLQPQTDLAVPEHSDFGSMIQANIFYSTAETLTSLVLEQWDSQAAPAHDILVPNGMLSLFFDDERIDLKSAYYRSAFGWLRRLISGKEQKKKPRLSERKPEQRKLPTRREGGREPREPREPDAWE